MKVTVKQKQEEIRGIMLEGLKQAKQRKTKDFDAVCDRLEKKYINAEMKRI